MLSRKRGKHKQTFLLATRDGTRCPAKYTWALPAGLDSDSYPDRTISVTDSTGCTPHQHRASKFSTGICGSAGLHDPLG